MESNCISVNRNGSVGYAFYHCYEALYGNDTRKLNPVIKNMILQQKEKYRYAYKFNGDRMARQKIMMPVDDNSRIDYRAIKNYMKAKELKLVVNGILKHPTYS